MDQVTPILDVTHAASGVRVEARIKALPPRPVEWRLTVDTAGPGGRSRIAQAGAAQGSEGQLLAAVQVDNPGEAELQVFQHGRLVASASARFRVP